MDKEYIKKLLSISESDILFEKFMCLLDNDDEIVYEPKGLFNRGILKDTGKVSKGRENHLFIEVNRPGLYDVLPKGLFHDKVDDFNNQKEFFDKIEKERKEIRRMFLPFDSTYFSAIANVERENAKHFKNKYDSKIAFELLKFYNIFDELDFLSIIEILFIDFVKNNKCKNDKIEIEKFIPTILPSNILFKNLFVNLMDSCMGETMVLRFLYALPYAPKYTADIDKIQKLLRYVLGTKVFVIHKKEFKKIPVPELPNNILTENHINSSNSSLILGNTFFDEINHIYITIEISEYNMFVMNCFQTGSINKLIQLFLSHFIPINYEFEIRFSPKANSNTGFALEPVNNEQFLMFSEIKNSLVEFMHSINTEENWDTKNMTTEYRMELIEYLNLFYKLLLKENASHSFLNMNSKI